jgi:transcriptional regulator with XRE-family HTH domain
MPSPHTSDGHVFRNPYDVVLGAVLREVREHHNLSRTAIECATNGRIRTRDLEDWERGARGMRIATLGDLCSILSVPTSVVLDHADALYRVTEQPGVERHRADLLADVERYRMAYWMSASEAARNAGVA